MCKCFLSIRHQVKVFRHMKTAEQWRTVWLSSWRKESHEPWNTISSITGSKHILSVFCVQNRVVDGENVGFRIRQKHIQSYFSLTTCETMEQPPPRLCSKWGSPSELMVAIHTSGLSNPDPKSNLLEVLGIFQWETGRPVWKTGKPLGRENCRDQWPGQRSSVPPAWIWPSTGPCHWASGSRFKVLGCDCYVTHTLLWLCQHKRGPYSLHHWAIPEKSNWAPKQQIPETLYYVVCQL